MCQDFFFSVKVLICVFQHGLQEWPKGSLEEVVQNAIKSWEMELSHKIRLQDFKTINPDKFKLIVNGTVPNLKPIFLFFFDLN